MKFLRDIVTAVRGGVNEVGEAIVDNQAMRILEQEIRDAEDAISNAKVSLSQLKAKEIGMAKKINDIDTDILQKAKTYEDLQKTQKVVAAAMPTNDSSAKRVQRAMDRVKQKQSDTEDRMSADQWLADLEEGSDLDSELAAAGIGKKSSSADDILAELEGKK